jgi:hypothetical protein
VSKNVPALTLRIQWSKRAASGRNTMARHKPTRSLYPPKPKGPKDPKKVAAMNANRLVTVRLTMRHFINGVVYGPGDVSVANNLAQGMLHTEGHAAAVEEQFQGAKAAIIGPRRAGGTTFTEVAPETFDDSWGRANPADVVRGGGFQDSGSNKF